MKHDRKFNFLPNHLNLPYTHSFSHSSKACLDVSTLWQILLRKKTNYMAMWWHSNVPLYSFPQLFLKWTYWQSVHQLLDYRKTVSTSMNQQINLRNLGTLPLTEQLVKASAWSQSACGRQTIGDLWLAPRKDSSSKRAQAGVNLDGFLWNSVRGTAPRRRMVFHCLIQ